MQNHKEAGQHKKIKKDIIKSPADVVARVARYPVFEPQSPEATQEIKSLVFQLGPVSHQSPHTYPVILADISGSKAEQAASGGCWLPVQHQHSYCSYLRKLHINCALRCQFKYSSFSVIY